MRFVYRFLIRHSGMVSSAAAMLTLILGLAFIIGWLRRSGDIKAMKEAARNHAAHHVTITENERRIKQLETDYALSISKINDLRHQLDIQRGRYDAAPTITLGSPLTHDTLTTAVHKIDLGEQTLAACQQVVAAQDGALVIADAQIKTYKVVVDNYKALELSNDAMRADLTKQLTIERTKKNLWKAGAMAVAGLVVYGAAKK